MSFDTLRKSSSRQFLTGRLVRPTELHHDQVASMYAVMVRHFEGIEWETFLRDLSEKDWVLLLESEDGLQGFSTIAVYPAEVRRQRITVVYSGDTIVARDAWGSSALCRLWIDSVLSLRDHDPARPCYWLLLCSGYRTYRFLPTFFKTFVPRHDRSTPPTQQSMLEELASARFGTQFVADSGIVRFSRAPQRLRPELAAIPPGRMAHPDVTFFLAKNPGHVDGDELVCLTEISIDNLTPAGLRMAAPVSQPAVR